jgi:GNAT superfamily N-acetyltransferase
VWELHIAVFEAAGTPSLPGPWNDDFANIESVYLRNRGEFLIGLLEGKIVAMGALRIVKDEIAEIKRMRVHPDHWRDGFGQAVFNRLQDRAIELGYRKLILDTMPQQVPAQRFYIKNGFRQTGRKQIEPFDCLFFEKELADATRNESASPAR